LRKNQKISWFLTIAFIFSILFSLPTAPAIAGIQDISSHWAKPQIEYLMAQKIISGYPDNTFRPENPISRAEFIVMTNKAFNFTASADINYSDVKPNDWFAADIARAKAAGYIAGYEDGTMKPKKQISRQEAATIIARILSLQPANVDTTLNKLSDGKKLASWSRNSIAAMVEKGYLKGYPDNSFKPTNSIKRAEAAVLFKAVLDNEQEAFKVEPKPEPEKVQTLFDKAGTYGPETGIQKIDDDVTISNNGVILNNTTITGNLTITEAVANGDVELNNVKVEGTAYINGGGENSITLNQCELNKAVVNKKDGKIRIVLPKDSSIKTLVADSGLRLVGSGKITDLTINSSGVEVEPKPLNKPFIKSGITARVGGEKISGTTSGGGGGGGGGGGPGGDPGSGTVVTTANVSSAAELNTALGNSNITTINLTASFSASPTTVPRSLTINFSAYTLTGDLTFNHTVTGTSVLTGNTGNRIIGNLTVDTPNASFNNGVAVNGTVTVANVASASWTESADGNTITITDPNGATITITGTPGSVTVTQDAGGNLTITVNPGASVTNITTNAPINIVVETGATVNNITANTGATGTTITNNGTTGTLTVNVPITLGGTEVPTNVTVEGTGTVTVVDTTTPLAPASFEVVNSFGIHADKVYASYKLMANGKQIALVASEIASMTVMEPGATETKILTVEGEIDPLLWFNVEKTPGDYKYTVVTKGEGAKIYTATLTWAVPQTATWEATDREGDHDGKTYVEYKLMDGRNPISLKEGEVKLIASKDATGKWIALEPNTDGTLWFNKAKETGSYEFFVVSSGNVMYRATLNWKNPSEEPVEPTPIQGSFESTGNVGIAPDTAGDAAGKIYAEYKLVVGDKDISLAKEDEEYIKVKVGKDGEWKELTANTDATLWFNVEAANGVRFYEVKTKDGKVYTATLDWQKEINNVSLTTTGREGTRPGTEDTYVEYEIKVGEGERLSLAEGAVNLIAQQVDGKWVELEPNTDQTLWFKKDKATGNYDFFVVTSEGAMYKATLAYTAPTELDSTIAKDAGTGGTGTTATVDGKTITFSGNIDWYPADDTLGRTEGNRVGVKITAPTTVTPGEAATLTFNQTTGEDKTITGWKNFSDGDNYFYFYPLVKEAGQTTTLVIKWDGTDATADTFTIKIAEGTTLVAAPIEPKVISGISVAARTGATNGDKIDVVTVTGSGKAYTVTVNGTGVLESVTSPSQGDGLWFGLQLSPTGVTDITELEYKTAIQTKFTALTEADATEAGVAGEIVWWINGNEAKTQDIYLKYAGEAEETAIKLTISFVPYKAPQVISGISVAARTGATNGDKIDVATVTGSDKEYAVTVTGTGELETVTGNPGGTPTEGLWFGLQLSPEGVTDITKLEYKTAIQSTFAALTEADATEAGVAGQIVWWINGDVAKTQDIYLKYAGEAEETAIKLTISFVPYKAPQVISGISVAARTTSTNGDKIEVATVTGSDKAYTVTVSGTGVLESVTSPSQGEGLWFGLQLLPTGVTDITKLEYKTAIQTNFTALTEADATEAGVAGEIVWWINGNEAKTQDIYLKYAGEAEETAIKLTISFVPYAAAQATPTFDPPAGAVAFGTTVTITSAGADAIYYTTNGSDPTAKSTNQATTPLVINSEVTVKAIAVKAGSPNSAIASATYTQAEATAPSDIVLAKGSANPVGGVTNVAIPAAGATDTTGAVTDWVTGTNDKIKFTVSDASGASSTITINGYPYTSGSDYTIAAANPLTIVVTTKQAGKTDAVRTFIVTVEAAEATPEEYHTYKYNIADLVAEYVVSEALENPTDTDFQGMTPVKLSIVVDETKDKAYTGNVRVAAVGAENLQLWAKDTANKWYDINAVGWGPEGGFPIDTTLVTDVYIVATATFDGNVNLKLVDITGDYGATENIIISQDVAVKAVVDEAAAIQAALDSVNNASSADNYAAVKTALEENAAKLGLNLDQYNQLTPGGRKNAVANDIYNNKPDNRYTLETLKPMFDEIVATRMVFQESVAIFAAASESNPLTDLSYITMLQNNLNAVTLQKVHSGKSIEEVILPELNGLVTDFNALTAKQKTAVLAGIDYSKNTSSTATRNALRVAIDKVVADEEAAVQAVLDAVNAYLTPENYVYAEAPGALGEHLATLGLQVGEGSDYVALDKTTTGGKNRKTAVFYDLNNNKPSKGYDLATLTTYFNDMVATRLVTEKSMDLVNNAENIDALNGISFVTMLLERFQTVTYGTHSDIPVADKISTLEGLETRYNNLPSDADRDVVLQKLLGKRPEGGYARSQATTDALAVALTEVEGDQVTAALSAINDYLTPEKYVYAEAPGALEGYLTTLGVNVGAESDYAALDKTATGGKNRKTAVFYDLNNNKPSEGYDLATLTTYFNDMVATRLVTEESMDLVNNAENIEALNGISFVTMLLERFQTVSYGTHSDIPVATKISTLEDLVTRYNALDADGKAAVLQKVFEGIPYTRSQATTDAMNAALTEVEEGETAAVQAALDAVNNASSADNYAAVKTALEENAAKLGLNLDQYNQLTPEGRKNAVANDIYNNKPEGGYTLETLKPMFDEIVATRMVFQESVAIFAAASSSNPLTNMGFITMLITNLNAVQLQTLHSGKNIKTEILPELNGLVTDFGNLPQVQQTAALKGIDYSKKTSSTATRNALRTAIDGVKTETTGRLTITSVTIADNKAYASTAAGEGKTVRVLGYGVGINLNADSSGKKISDTTSIVVELYKGQTLLGQQTFNATGYSKHADKSATSGTIDAGGQYKATSWDNSWSAGITDIPDKAVAKVQYIDGTATAEMTPTFTDTKIFEAAEAVYALFTNPLADVGELTLTEGVNQEAITAAGSLVTAVSDGSSHKTLFVEMIAKANSLLNPDQGSDGGTDN